MSERTRGDAIVRSRIVAAIAGCALAGLAIAGAQTLTSETAVNSATVSTPLAPREVHDRIQLRPGERLAVTMPDGSSREVRSLLNVLGPQGFGSFVWNEDGAGNGFVWARVDLGAQTLSLFRGADEIGTAVIVYGTSTKPTPLGWFRILDKQRNYHSRTYDAPMPWMLRLTDDGVALHASHVRKGRATHGCIGTPDEFASQLFAAMNRGDWVLIVNT